MKSRSEIYLLNYVLCSNKHDEISSSPNYLPDSWIFFANKIVFKAVAICTIKTKQTDICKNMKKIEFADKK